MEQVPPPDRVLTVPNLLSAIRLALIPVFVYVLLFAHANGWAVAILMFSGASDWADGLQMAADAMSAGAPAQLIERMREHGQVAARA